jgi:hypothetical protein
MLSEQANSIGAPTEFWITQWKLGSNENPIVRRAGNQEVRQHLSGRKKRLGRKQVKTEGLTAESMNNNVEKAANKSRSRETEEQKTVEKRKRVADLNEQPVCKKSVVLLNGRNSSYSQPFLTQIPLPSQTPFEAYYNAYPIPSIFNRSPLYYPLNYPWSPRAGDLYYHVKVQHSLQHPAHTAQPPIYSPQLPLNAQTAHRPFVNSPSSFLDEEEHLSSSAVSQSPNQSSPVPEQSDFSGEEGEELFFDPLDLEDINFCPFETPMYEFPF